MGTPDAAATPDPVSTLDASPGPSNGSDAGPGPAADASAQPLGVDAAGCPSKPTAGDYPLDVAAVIQAKCQGCHKKPPINHAPFPLLTYEDTLAPDPIQPYAGMPIWEAMSIVIQPSGVPHMPFGNAPQLTAAEFQTLNGWLFSCAMPVSDGTGGDLGEDAGASAPVDAASD